MLRSILLLIFAQTVLSCPWPDFLNSRAFASRSTEAISLQTSYTSLSDIVVPINFILHPQQPVNATEIAETQAFFHSLPPGVFITHVQEEKQTIYWRISVHDKNALKALKDYKGSGSMKLADSSSSIETNLSAAELLDLAILPVGSRAEPPGPKIRYRKRRAREKSNVPLYYAGARDPTNQTEVRETRKFLDSVVVDKTQFITEIPAFPDINLIDVRSWGGLALDAEALEKVKNYPGIAGVEEVFPVSWKLKSDTTKSSSKSGGLRILLRRLIKRINIFKRDLYWMKQRGPVDELIVLSQYPGKDLNELDDFVFEYHAGAGTFVYVLDWGVQVGVLNEDGRREFPRYEILQTATSMGDPPDPPDTDEHDASHGTMMASRALGQLYGVAKAATLVSVKCEPDYTDIVNGLGMTFNHIVQNRRYGRSVVLVTFGANDVLTRDQALQTTQGQDTFRALDYMRRYGIPVVVAAGNRADEDRPGIDDLPGVMEAPQTPMILVGASDDNDEGDRAEFSQGAGQVHIYAPGVKCISQTKVDGEPEEEDGTSISAAMVAGLIAAYMGYPEQLPFPWPNPTTPIEQRVFGIRGFLQSAYSSWERKANSGIRIIWNGATEQNHRNAYPWTQADATGTKAPTTAATVDVTTIQGTTADPVSTDGQSTTARASTTNTVSAKDPATTTKASSKKAASATVDSATLNPASTTRAVSTTSTTPATTSKRRSSIPIAEPKPSTIAKSSAAPPPAPKIEKKCYGLKTNRFLTNTTVDDAITEYCRAAQLQGTLDPGSGSLQRRYYPKTPEEFSLAMEWRPGLKFKPDEVECTKWLHELLYRCEEDDPKRWRWRGGGTVQVGDVKYRIDPLAPRPPVSDKLYAGCDVTWSKLWMDVAVWGARWANTDGGEKIKAEFKRVGLAPTKFRFSYGNGDDGREWIVKFRILVASDFQIEPLLKRAGAKYQSDWDGVNCT